MNTVTQTEQEFLASLHAMTPAAAEPKSYREKQAYAEGILTRPRFMPRAAFAFDAALLKSALFRAGTGPRAAFETRTPIPAHNASADTTVFYRGEELRQDDQRVLLTLLRMRFGQTVDNVLTLTPRVFVRDVLRWADSGASVAKLRASIMRLRYAVIELENNELLSSYSLISDFDFSDKTWYVWLSPRLCALFANSPATTFLDSTQRLELADGFSSWMFGYIKADACFAPILLANLRSWSGLDSYSQKNFNRKLRETLTELQAAGVLHSFEVSGARLWIQKSAPVQHVHPLH